MADEKQTEQRLKFFRPQEHLNVYSNSVRLNITPWDFRFSFGEIGEIVPGEEIPVPELVRVTMSPQHAKAFLKIFADNVTKFEEKFGEIKTPDKD